MKTDRIVFLTVIIGLLTGIIALATSYYGPRKETAAISVQNIEQKEKVRNLTDETNEIKTRIAESKKAQQDLLDQIGRMAESGRICGSHMANAQRIEDRFSALMTEYGTMLRFAKSCASMETEGAKGLCLATACAAAGSLDQCIGVGNELMKVNADRLAEKTSAEGDHCTLPRSAIDEFVRT